MIFEEVPAGGCLSYLVGCPETCSAVLIDPELSQVDRYLALAARTGLRFHYIVDTHTHADHFSAARELARRLEVPSVMHRASLAPYVDVPVDDGETIIAGRLRLRAAHQPHRRQDRRPAPRRGGEPHLVHVDGGSAGARDDRRPEPRDSRRPGA